MTNLQLNLQALERIACSTELRTPVVDLMMSFSAHSHETRLNRESALATEYDKQEAEMETAHSKGTVVIEQLVERQRLKLIDLEEKWEKELHTLVSNQRTDFAAFVNLMGSSTADVPTEGPSPPKHTSSLASATWHKVAKAGKVTTGSISTVASLGTSLLSWNKHNKAQHQEDRAEAETQHTKCCVTIPLVPLPLQIYRPRNQHHHVTQEDDGEGSSSPDGQGSNVSINSEQKDNSVRSSVRSGGEGPTASALKEDGSTVSVKSGASDSTKEEGGDEARHLQHRSPAASTSSIHSHHTRTSSSDTKQRSAASSLSAHSIEEKEENASATGSNSTGGATEDSKKSIPIASIDPPVPFVETSQPINIATTPKKTVGIAHNTEDTFKVTIVNEPCAFAVDPDESIAWKQRESQLLGVVNSKLSGCLLFHQNPVNMKEDAGKHFYQACNDSSELIFDTIDNQFVDVVHNVKQHIPTDRATSSHTDSDTGPFKHADLFYTKHSNTQSANLCFHCVYDSDIIGENMQQGDVGTVLQQAQNMSFSSSHSNPAPFFDSFNTISLNNSFVDPQQQQPPSTFHTLLQYAAQRLKGNPFYSLDIPLQASIEKALLQCSQWGLQQLIIDISHLHQTSSLPWLLTCIVVSLAHFHRLHIIQRDRNQQLLLEAGLMSQEHKGPFLTVPVPSNPDVPVFIHVPSKLFQDVQEALQGALAL